MALKKFRKAVDSLVNEQLDRDRSMPEIASVLRKIANSMDTPLPQPATNVELFDLAVEAANTFKEYAINHMAKEPPQIVKAKRNSDMARKLYAAVGDPQPPVVAAESCFDDWKAMVEAESAPTPPTEPVDALSGFSAPLDAEPGMKQLVRRLHEASEEGEKIKAISLQGDDRLYGIIFSALGWFKVDDVTDVIAIGTEARLWAGIRPKGAIDLPVEVAEVTGNIDEAELVARYIESKIAAIDKAIAMHDSPKYEMQCSWHESYQHAAITLREMVKEFRMGLHLPTVHIEGRVIPYNDDRGTGVQHRVALGRFFDDVYQRNVKAGWWTNIEDGTPKKRNAGELLILMVTEMSEAYRAFKTGEPDDKLSNYPGLGVEMGDLAIRLADFCGALSTGNLVAYDPTGVNPGEEMFVRICAIADEYEAIRKTPAAVGDPETGDYLPAQDVAEMIDAKLDFNATRADHKIENRLKDDGKRT